MCTARWSSRLTRVIGYELALPTKQGQYQGLFNTGIAAVQMFGPVS